MTPSTASRETQIYRSSAHRRTSARRRRWLALLVLVAVAGGVALWLGPGEKALREITLPLRHEDIIRQQAREKHLDPALIAAVIYQESKFSDRTSAAGAKGLMQILPSTARFIAKRSGGTAFVPSDLATPQVNIAYGSYYLRYLLDLSHGNEIAAVAAYNAGHERVDSWGGSRLGLEDIRFPETRQYTRDVLDKRDEYAKRYKSELGLAD